MTYRSNSSNRLWAAVAVLALLVGVLFIIDPFAPDDSDPLLDGLNDAPFVAVLQRDEIPSVEADEVLEKLEVPASGDDVGEVDDGVPVDTDASDALSGDRSSRGTRPSD